MAHSGSRSGAANLAIPLMILTFLVIGGFLWWLNATAVGTEGNVEMTGNDTTADAGPTAREVTLAQLQDQPDSLMTGEIRVAGATVLSRMGAQAFWIELPGGNPFLVKLAPALVQDSLSVQQSQTVAVTGDMHAMSDSVLDAWTTGGVINDGQRLEAEFATHFIEASQVRARGGQGGGDGGGEQDGGGDAG